jgi:DNA repair protein RadD
MTFTPRPYQAATHAAVNQFWAEGKLFPLVIAPTGAGKTEISKMILADFRSPMAVVHTITLFEQTARRVPQARVYTLQSLLAPGPKGDARRAGLARHDVAWFDEGHHLGGEDWRRVLSLPALPARRFGVTATPMRADGTPLGDIYDCFHVSAKYSELVRDGHLVKCDVQRSEISRSHQKKQKVRPDGVIAYLESARRADGSWRPGIHFETTVEACESANQRYNESGVRSALITNKTDKDERFAIFDRYTRGELDMLCSPTVLAEGFDSPRAEVCVLRRSTDHVGDYLQRVGRVLRPFPGKDRALLIDICNASTKRSHGLPTDDRIYSLDGKGIRSVEEAAEDEALALPAPTPYEMVQSKFRLIRDTLLSRYRDLQAQAEELGYKPGWVWHRFTEATSIAAPANFTAKFASVCVHCRKRLKVGELMFWSGSKQAFHEECWFDSLDEGKLAAASEALEHAQEWRPSRTRRDNPAMDRMIENDDIPF